MAMDGETANPAKQGGRQTAESARGILTRSKPTVCTACRQAKVRCMGSRDGSCSRCVRLRLDCNRDSGFKRVSKDRKLAELEKQVHLLVSAAQPAAGQPVDDSQIQQPQPLGQSQGICYANNITTDLTYTLENRSPMSLQQQLGAPPACLTPPDNLSARQRIPYECIDMSMQGVVKTRPPSLTHRTLEAVQIDQYQIDNLFQAFFEHYHPFLPFLNPIKSPDDYYTSGISLFWTIIAVASRRYRDDVTLLYVLSDLVMKLIWAEIAKPPYKVPTVQAILLVCIWPFPTTTMYHDVSVTLSSVAINIAMQVGLHRPFNRQDFLRSRIGEVAIHDIDFGVLSRTWVVANIVSQSVAAAVGQASQAPFDWIIDESCETGSIYTLPDELRFKLIIQRYCYKITKATWDIDCNPAPVANSWRNDLAMLDSELNGFESENNQLFTTIDRLYLAGARLYLHSFYLFDSLLTESRMQGILKTYKSAVKVISLFASADAAAESLLYLSFYHLRMLLTAACIILKVSKSSYAPELGDSEYRKKMLNDAILALVRSSVSNNDAAGKAVKLMSRMWHNSDGSADQLPPSLTVKSRGGASIIYDFVWSCRKEFGVSLRTNTGPTKAVQSHQPLVTQGTTSFDNAIFFNQDFLDDPSWSFDLAEPLISSVIGK